MSYMNLLAGKVALVTGASKGIGRAIALELASNGANVCINYKSDDVGAEETLKMIKDKGVFGMLIKGDVSKYNETKKIIDEVVKNFGKLDILVNNAGISKIGLFIDMEEVDFEEIINVNLKGVINCSHCAAKHMLQRSSGSIINISSMWGEVGASCEVLYSASKGGVNAFTKALARELGPSNIRVNAIAPGVINTQMNNWLSEDEKTELKEEIALNKFGEGRDIGGMAVFLASDKAKFITAQIITIDGGMI